MFKQILTALCIVSLLCGCSSGLEFDEYLEVDEIQTPLGAGLLSYTAYDRVKTQLKLQDSDIVIIEDSKPKLPSHVPPFNILTIKIPDFEILGDRGDLVLSFFNDRLMETRFYPPSTSDFLNKSSIDVNRLGDRTKIVVKPYTNIWLYKDFEDKEYVGWADVRLIKQTSMWIKKYS